MPAHRPCQAEKVFRAEDRPDEQMGSEHRARRHDRNKTGGDESGHARHVRQPVIWHLGHCFRLRDSSLLSQHLTFLRDPIPATVGKDLLDQSLGGSSRFGEGSQDGGTAPPDCPGPITREKQQADRYDVVVRHAVVGIAEIDTGYRVGAPEAEEVSVGKEERDNS